MGYNKAKQFSVLLLTAVILAGCSEQRSSFLDPAGPIAAAQRAHLIEVVGWTMIAVVPVFILVPVMLWRYRYRNTKARYTPDWGYSGWLELVMWGVPFMIVAVLSTKLWFSTKALDPYKPIASDAAPLNVQVVGLDWKWLFIYPDLGIATVNQLAFPAGAPVSLNLTSDTVMQSFMVDALAGQVYAMPGMRTKLHLLADAAGVFKGENVQFSGVGFTEQKFDAVAMTPEAFSEWVARVKSDGVPLDAQTYELLGASSTGAQVYEAIGTNGMPAGVIYFNQVAPDLFKKVIGRYHGGEPVLPANQPGAAGYVWQPLFNGSSK
ncbi:cytochrome o ubiquinol oxidase subunit 2 [Nitrosomonas sp. Nm51]|uniref:cytochrome ubiquinol oxidase subunit II n=1 Tax=Nitrosomonas sp. Nm51 TaxID=133720 RepID=UPI0008B36EC3|nr:cytochrome ubiquinol oxidase subunit II [Nitrosomonas sp. Nm51]SEQ90898.1 cytochrome o ubiquinol oxidase subunit 2 [Nitrosomonas sp. Nm51]